MAPSCYRKDSRRRAWSTRRTISPPQTTRFLSKPVARTGAIELTLDGTTLERDDNGVVTDGQVTTLTLDADGTLDAEGTVDLTGNPAWELTDICANP